MPMRPFVILAATVLGTFGLVDLPRDCAATTIVIDGSTSGTLYDGLLDGFPIGALPKDGTADLAGNALGVALKSGVTEERGIAEFPLASLAGLTSTDVDVATLTFNIDDVLSTFGPGTDFDGTATDTFVLFSYFGNGTIDLADFGNVAGQPLATVDTTPNGVITDVTLAASGPIVFEVDVTTRVRALLDANATHFGVVWTTDDDQSGTSIDDLGNGGAGPAGTGGAAMPFVTIRTVSSDPPILGKAALKCQKTIVATTRAYAATALKEIAACTDLVLATVAKGKPAAAAAAKCAVGADPANAGSKLAKARVKAVGAIVKTCEPVPLAELGPPCDAAAADWAAVASCTLDRHRVGAETAVRSAYDDACMLLGAVGLDGAFTTICGAL